MMEVIIKNLRVQKIQKKIFSRIYHEINVKKKIQYK